MNQAEKILTKMTKDFHPKDTFTLREISSFLDNPKNRDFALSITDADSPYWQLNYLASIFLNATTRGKNPKLIRAKYNKVYGYTLKS